MNKIYCQFISLILLLNFAVITHGATFNPEKSRDHGSWSSLKLTLGAQRFYRAINVVDYSDMRVMVDFDAENCEPELEIQIENDRSFERSESIGLGSVAIRVDRKPVHEGLMESQSISGDPTMYGFVMVSELSRLISEMRMGRVLRFKFSALEGNSEPIFAELGLNGSQAALDRAAALCKQDQAGPEDFFEENGESGDESAEDYF